MTDFSKYGSSIKEESTAGNSETNFSKYGKSVAPSVETEKKTDKSELSALERFKMSFATKETRDNLDESKKGFMKGGIRELIGDVADVAGGTIPLALGTLGAAGGAVGGYGVGAIPGAAVGVGAGESVRATIGQLMGVRDDAKPIDELVTPIKEGVKALVGGKIVQKGGGYVVSLFPKLMGILTGKSDDIVKAAFSNPKAADAGLAKGEQALIDIVEQGKTKSVELRDSFNGAYQSAFQKISGAFGSREIDHIPMFQKFTDVLKSKGVVFSRDGVPDYTTSKISANPGEVEKINAAITAMQNWKKNGQDWSLNGMIKLKQQIGALTKFAREGGGESKSPVLGQMYHFIDQQIRQTLPKTARAKYDAINGNYSKMIDVFDDMVDAFNAGKNPYGKIAGMFSKNNIKLREILKYYEEKTGISISGTVAGRELGEQSTQSAIEILKPSFWFNLLVPKSVQGKLITIPGRVNEKIVQPVVDKAVDAVQYPGKTLDQLMSR